MFRTIHFLLIFLMMTFSGNLITAQSKRSHPGADDFDSNVPVLSKYSKQFELRHVNFNKKIDLRGRGEILEVEFEVVNLIDDPIEFYLFVIATYEKDDAEQTSFDMPVPIKERLRSFVPFPNDLKNFAYPIIRGGKILKDKNGKELVHYLKYPNDYKKGVNPETGKIYKLEEKLLIRTEHLSRYRANYSYFNNVTIMMFDKEGNPIFRQLYELIGWRR